ncbi:hypothetical protein D3C86_1870260 [compost metagenome]
MGMHNLVSTLRRHGRFCLGNYCSAGIQDRVAELKRRRVSACCKVQLGIYIHCPGSAVRRSGGYIDTIRYNMRLRIRMEPDGAVDPRAGIPAGIRRLMNNPHYNRIVSRNQKGSNLELKG